MLIILFSIYLVNSKNIKANRNFKVPQITADYLVKCKNVFTYYLEQKNTITLEEEFQAEKTEIDHISAADIQGISEDKPIIFESPILLQSGPIRSTTLYNQFGFIQTWTILHHDDFETRSSLLGWNIPHRAYCELKGIHYTDTDTANDHFLHEPNCNSNTPSLSKTFTTDIQHNHLRVSAELSIFGDWNGDSINVLLDNKIVWSKVFQGEISQAEHPCPQLFALGVPVQFTVEHNSNQFTVTFQANHKRHPCDGSFGVDDIIVYYKYEKMQQLLKPSINIDFSEAELEDEQQPIYSLEFMKAKRDEMKHVNKFEEAKKKIIPKVVPQRPMSAQAKKQPTMKHKFLVKKEDNRSAQISPAVSTSKSVRFGKTYISETVPVMSSENTEAILKKQSLASGTINKKNEKTQQQPNQIIQRKTEQEVLQKIGLLEWDDDLDDQFYIKDAKKLLTQNGNGSSKMLTIEKTNRENFIKKFKPEEQINKPLTNNDVLKQQQKEIQQKIENIQQLRMNEILSKQLVISQVPNQEEEQYDNDFEQEVEVEKEVHKSQEEEYANEEFEVEEEKPIEKKEVKQVEVKKPKKQSKKRVNTYRAKNAKERKQELLNMRSELEKQLLENNEVTAKLYKQLQDTTEKERVMIEINTKRKDELIQAQLTLQQLKEKLEQQQQIIEELDKKEHYAQQIIEKLKDNKSKYQQQYDQEIEKYLACKVIARFLRGYKDRKLYQEMKRQRFINKIKINNQ